MDLKPVILGLGVLGAGALIVLGSQNGAFQSGGAGGGMSKKAQALIEPSTTETIETTETTTTAPAEIPAPVYNIIIPEPDFPSVPLSLPQEPWWVSSLAPPSTPSAGESKKSVSSTTGFFPVSAKTQEVRTQEIETLVKKKAVTPEFASAILAVQSKFYGGG